MTTTDLRGETAEPTSTDLHPGAKPVDSRHYRFDLIGAAALVIAGAGLAGSLILFRAQSTDSTTTASIRTPSASVATVRDQWYLESSGSQTTQTKAQLAMKDRWYKDAAPATVVQANGPALRDQWYLESPALRSVPSVSTQARDRWYLDDR